MSSDPVDPDAVATVALACPDVVGLSSGRFGEVATYLPGRRVNGVRVAAGELQVHIVARWGPPLPEVAEYVRHAVAPLSGGRPVAVVVDDVDVSVDLSKE